MIPAPPPSSIKDNRGQGLKTLRERCDAMGLPTWRLDNSGLILSEPSDGGPVGLLFGSSTFTKLISDTVRTWSSLEEAVAAEIFEGAWALPLAEKRRRDRTGWTLVLALSEKALNSPFFENACAGAALDVQAMRRMLLPKAKYGAGSVAPVRDMLLWMAQDLGHVEECDHTVAGFTRQLSDCFETIDVLYSLGRSMNELTHPGQFVEHVCGRLRATLSFGFVGACFGVRDTMTAQLPNSFFLSGPCAGPTDINNALRALIAAGQLQNRSTILTDLNGVPIAGAGQILVHPVMRAGKVVGVVFAGDKFGDDPQVSSYDIQLLEAAAGYLGAFLDNVALYAEQKDLFEGTLEALTASIDAKDRYTCGHSQRVAQLSWQLATAAGMGEAFAERVRIAGLVHDVGKIGVPEAVLTKSGKLTDEEFGAIKKHPEIGYRILKDLAALQDVLPGVLHHHERFDGRGYPHGLKGTDIPEMARIIALADTFDAMSSTRSYRSAMPRATVLAEIQRCSGAQFDPELTKRFVALDFTEFDRMVGEASAGAAAQESQRQAA
jgi:HD-GYP domain-containing protein (c-di-GMP phosphodiesterase class II)